MPIWHLVGAVQIADGGGGGGVYFITFSHILCIIFKNAFLKKLVLTWWETTCIWFVFYISPNSNEVWFPPSFLLVASILWYLCLNPLPIYLLRVSVSYWFVIAFYIQRPLSPYLWQSPSLLCILLYIIIILPSEHLHDNPTSLEFLILKKSNLFHCSNTQINTQLLKKEGGREERRGRGVRKKEKEKERVEKETEQIERGGESSR